jgi:hypothetical protein
MDREEGPWILLVATAGCAPLAVLAQGGDGLAIEMMMGVARLGLALAPGQR